MRIFELRPEVTDWEEGRHWRAGGWHAKDFVNTEGRRVREVHHHGTAMVLFYFMNRRWRATPLSLGHGSHSDQNGVNMLLMPKVVWHNGGRHRLQSYGWRYRRDHGLPRIETVAK